jgi:hypothetical protein
MRYSVQKMIINLFVLINMVCMVWTMLTGAMAFFGVALLMYQVVLRK